MNSINRATNQNKCSIMPHCNLEYSDNIIETDETLDILAELHELLVDSGHFQLEDIKSRTICHEEYHIGDGNPDNAFVHLNVSILSGRSLETRQELSDQILDFMKMQFAASLDQLVCQISVEISEITSETYAKETS